MQLTGLPNPEEEKNFIEIDINETKDVIMNHFSILTERPDIGIIIICEYVKEKIKNELKKYKKVLPVIIEIPSKIKY